MLGVRDDTLRREAADQLGLEPGMFAVAAVKATNVTVEILQTGWQDR